MSASLCGSLTTMTLKELIKDSHSISVRAGRRTAQFYLNTCLLDSLATITDFSGKLIFKTWEKPHSPTVRFPSFMSSCSSTLGEECTLYQPPRGEKVGRVLMRNDCQTGNFEWFGFRVCLFVLVWVFGRVFCLVLVFFFFFWGGLFFGWGFLGVLVVWGGLVFLVLFVYLFVDFLVGLGWAFLGGRLGFFCFFDHLEPSVLCTAGLSRRWAAQWHSLFAFCV